MSDAVSITVSYILQQFIDNSIKYAVLRNYEQLPEVDHDLDLVCPEHQIPKIRSILVDAAKRNNWEHLIEYPHYNSFVYSFNITVFKFYNVATNTFLQIDLFGGFSIYAAEAISAEEFIARRSKYNSFYKIDFYDEMIIRAMQLGCAIRDKNLVRVVKLKKLIANADLDKMRIAFMIKTKCKTLPDFLYHLDNNTKFLKAWQRYKLKYLLLFFCHYPHRALVNLFFRIWYLIKLNYLYNPGVVLFVGRTYYRSNQPKFADVLTELKQNNFIMDFHIVDKLSLRDFCRLLRVKKLGGIVVWPLFLLKRNVYTTKEAFIKKLITKGKLLYSATNSAI